MSRSHNGRATTSLEASARHQPCLAATDNDAAVKSPMPAWVKDCRTAVAGLAVGCLLVVSPAATLAAGTATATIDATSTMHVAAGFGSSYETLDFSLPSYGDSQSSSSSPKRDVPSFNPFGDFEPSIKTQTPATAPASTKVVETAATTTAPEPIAVPDFKLPEMKMPDMPAMKLPEMKMPEMKMPDMPAMKMPDISASSSSKVPDMPAMKMPDVKMPDMPELKMPDFKMPEFTAPKFPSSFQMPEISLPKLPESVSGGTAASPKMTIPEVSMPDMPKFSVPAVSMPELNLPKINLPSLPNPFGGGGGGAAQVDYAATPQAVRDEAAKAARSVYLDADQLAKDAEAKAREIRQAAGVQKKAADVAKDTACATRPGGKWICLRNPFNVGY